MIYTIIISWRWKEKFQSHSTQTHPLHDSKKKLKKTEENIAREKNDVTNQFKCAALLGAVERGEETHSLHFGVEHLVRRKKRQHHLHKNGI